MYLKSYLLLEIHIKESKCESDRAYKNYHPPKTEKGYLIYKCNKETEMFIGEMY